MKLRDLFVRIGFDINANALNALDSRITEVKGNILSLNSVIIGIAASTGFFVKSAGDLEQVSVAFETIFGSAQKAQRVIKDIKDLTEVTTFRFPAILTVGKQLAAAEVPAEKIKETIEVLADIASGVSTDIERFGFVFQRVKGAGALQGIVRRIVEATGLPLTPILLRELGVDKKGLRRMIQEREITFEIFFDIIKKLRSKEGPFFEAAIKQAKTFNGIISIIGDRLDIIAKDVGGKLLPQFKKMVLSLKDFLAVNKQIITTRLADFYLRFVDAVKLGVRGLVDIAGFAVKTVEPLFQSREAIDFLTSSLEVLTSFAVFSGLTKLALKILSIGISLISLKGVAGFLFLGLLLDLKETFEGKDTIIQRLLDFFKIKFPNAFHFTKTAIIELTKAFNEFFTKNEKRIIALSAITGFILTPGGLTAKAFGGVGAALIAGELLGFNKEIKENKGKPANPSDFFPVVLLLNELKEKISDKIKKLPPLKKLLSFGILGSSLFPKDSNLDELPLGVKNRIFDNKDFIIPPSIFPKIDVIINGDATPEAINELTDELQRTVRDLKSETK